VEAKDSSAFSCPSIRENAIQQERYNTLLALLQADEEKQFLFVLVLVLVVFLVA
jgi:hypothetical protein